MNEILSFMRNMLQLVFAPARGWEDLEESERGLSASAQEQAAQRLYYRCFLPVSAICALSCFVRLLYGDAGGWLGCLQLSIVTFVSLFLSAQVARWAMAMTMPRLVSDDPREPSDAEWPKSRGLEMICYSLTFMALVFLLANVVKVKITLIEFLPFYVIFIIWKGWRYVGVKERNVGLFMIMETAAIVGSVYLWSFFLNVVI